MTPTVRIPSGPITPHGAYHILRDRIPQMALRSFDDSVVINLMGGLAIPDTVMAPERVEITSLKGLVPPWQTVDQKGATQDGVTFLDALFDPIEVEMDVKVKGRDPAHLRRTVRYLLDSIDQKRTSELSFTTQRMGRWWAPIRWFKTPDSSVNPTNSNVQELSLRLRADDGFWRSYDCVDEFRFAYTAASDQFGYTTSSELGSGWTVSYSGTGGGFIYATGSGAAWHDGTGSRTATCRRNGYTSATDNQVVDMVLGAFEEWSWPDNAYNGIWARMNNTGTPGTDGIRLRIASAGIHLSYFVGGVETPLRDSFMFPPFPGEKFTLVAGFENDPNLVKVRRDGVTVMSVKLPATGPLRNSSHRAAGFDMHAGTALITQATPSSLRGWAAGDNATVSQSGFVRRVNMGDQPFWDRYTCYGPGTFSFGNGPGSTDMVQFGPLLPNQVMQVRTDPRKYGVVDCTTIPPTPQELNFFQEALKDLLSFASGGQTAPLFTEIESLFGIAPPQGNPYSLLKGRFSNPIPALSPGLPPVEYHVAVAIDGGNADSKILASATPLRRYPF